MHFNINGQPIETTQDKKLLEFLREDMNLTGTKDGCAEGACGTCTVIVNGIAKKACVVKLSQLEGKSVTTIEGLSEKEKEVYAYSFARAGAVQCGFCTPGMIMAAKALLDSNKSPTREDVKKARLVANPGCYTTCSILTAYPLAREGLIDMSTLIIDAKSGTSGAGRGAKVQNLFCEVNENMKAYGVASHRHTPEIEEQLGYAAGEQVVLSFTPHLVPMNRGILATEYANLKRDVSWEDVKAAYDKYYGDEEFIRVLDKGVCPETKWVEGSNYVDIGFQIDSRTDRIIMMGAIDNLVKGAAGQAVQNMNLMFGLKESEGLELVPMFP